MARLNDWEETHSLPREFRNDATLRSEYQILLAESVDKIRRYGYSRSSGYQVSLRVQPHV